MHMFDIILGPLYSLKLNSLFLKNMRDVDLQISPYVDSGTFSGLGFGSVSQVFPLKCLNIEHPIPDGP